MLTDLDVEVERTDDDLEVEETFGVLVELDVDVFVEDTVVNFELMLDDVEVEIEEDLDDVECTDVDVVITELDVLDLLLVVDVTLRWLLLDPVGESIYSSKRFPAPQYSRLFPGQMKLQSVMSTRVEVDAREFPQ